MLHPVLAVALLVALAACRHAPEPATQVLLLGETHDNAEGHRMRAALLRERIEAGWRPAIAMEQFDTDQQSALDAAMASCADADCVVGKVAPAKSSWTWPYYTEVIALALQYKLPLRAANLSRADASKVVKGGFAAAVPEALVARYALATLPGPLLAAQETEVRDSHCGMLPESMVSPMAKAQIARDVVMAETMRTHAASGVVLIAGNGHVRGDIGVPYWLRRDGLQPRAVGFVEPGAGMEGFDETRAIAALQRPDACAQFKAPKAG